MYTPAVFDVAKKMLTTRFEMLCKLDFGYDLLTSLCIEIPEFTNALGDEFYYKGVELTGDEYVGNCLLFDVQRTANLRLLCCIITNTEDEQLVRILTHGFTKQAPEHGDSYQRLLRICQDSVALAALNAAVGTNPIVIHGFDRDLFFENQAYKETQHKSAVMTILGSTSAGREFIKNIKMMMLGRMNGDGSQFRLFTPDGNGANITLIANPPSIERKM
jgi:hypothetical protein